MSPARGRTGPIRPPRPTPSRGSPWAVTDLIVLLRVTPGVPFPVQNYLLGLAAVPFVRYLFVSCLIQLPINGAVIFFGDALLQGKGKIALVSLLLLIALTTGAHLARKHYGAKKKTSG